MRCTLPVVVFVAYRYDFCVLILYVLRFLMNFGLNVVRGIAKGVRLVCEKGEDAMRE